jgi:hypothetical protein
MAGNTKHPDQLWRNRREEKKLRKQKGDQSSTGNTSGDGELRRGFRCPATDRSRQENDGWEWRVINGGI